MKHVLPYSLFENQTAIQTLSKEQVSWLDNCTKGTWQLNPATGLVDVGGDFDCSEQGLRDFKGVRFGVVEGDFRCGFNLITSLNGAPLEVGGGFYCNHNQLTTMDGCPRKIGDRIVCSHNRLVSVDGVPQELSFFDCAYNRLTTLVGGPQEIRVSFFCGNNQLSSLEGAPREVGAFFEFQNNQITSLEGFPSKFKSMRCDENPVDEETLRKIIRMMVLSDKSYQEALESLWSEIPLEDQILLYRPEFEWIGAEEARKLDALKTYRGIKSMI